MRLLPHVRRKEGKELFPKGVFNASPTPWSANESSEEEFDGLEGPGRGSGCRNERNPRV
ncbi:hypothetical protein KY290_001266 [Solanum tuberosum]|uniref:Uncharacterized protein n=1 Tax=Solanum tuberosum TaxID=4113 RepID=A0ABQ7WLS5_SOLTU|nr:hypothetical protein KY290_001266 [Solanum tuberosum]